MMAWLGAAAMFRGLSDCTPRLLAMCTVLAIFAAAIPLRPYASLAQPSSIPAARGDVTGTVSDALGKPIVDATVALRTAQGHVIAVIHSDAGGRFAFHSLALGTYQVSAAKRDFVPANQE